MFSPAPFRFRDILTIQVFCAIVPLAAGLFTLLGLHSGTSGVSGAVGNLPPMRYLTAVSFLLCFAGIVFALFRTKSGILATASIIFSIGALDLYENLVGLTFDASAALGLGHIIREQFHGTAISSICFIFIGVAWAINCFRWKYGRIVAGSMGSFAFACGVSTLLGIIAGYPEMLRWGHSSEQSLLSGLAFTATGTVIIYESRRKLETGYLNWSHYIPVGILVTGLILSFCVRKALHIQEVNATDRTVSLQLSNLINTFESEMDRRIVANERMSNRWNTQDTIDISSWERDAWSYHRDFQTYQSLELIGVDGRVLGRVPGQTKFSSPDLNSSDSERLRDLPKAARKNRKSVVSRSVSLKDGGTGILSYSPIFNESEFKGFILGVFSVDKFFELTIPRQVRNDYSVAITDGGTLIYSTDRTNGGKITNIDQTKIIDFGGTSFILRIHPTRKLVRELSSSNDDLALLLGTLISILLSWSALLAARARRYSRVTQSSNKLLKSEIEVRKKIEKKHRETSRFREAILNGANYIIISTDQNGLITSFNRTAERLLGYTSDEVLGKLTLDHFHEESELTKYGEELSRIHGFQTLLGFETLVARAREHFADEHEWTYVRKDKSSFPVALSVTAMVEESGKVTGFLGIARDNSRLHMASRVLVESEGRFKAFVNNTPALTYIKDRSGRYQFVNSNFEKLFKVTQGSLIGKSDFAVTGRDSASKVLEIEKRVLETGTPEESVELVTLSDGRLAHFLFVRFVLPMAGGENGLGVIAIDLSAQKAVEEELRNVSNAAVEASRLKSEFLANMSHEIRTPMNGVLGMLEVLLDSSLNTSQRDYARVIQESAKSLMMILDDILDFSKLETGKLLFETIEFDLRATVENTIALYAEQCEAKQIEIVSLIAPDVPTSLLGDPGRVKQVLTNLIGNGVKFTDRGEVTVRISKAAAADERVTLRFEISDTGIGIPEETQKSLFNAFEQADGSLVRKYGGTGLGLSITKHLVEMMNGQITVQSKPGRGSRFSFTAVFGVQTSVKMPVPVVQLSGIKILIADDHEANRESISGQLMGLGMKTVSVPDGESCIKELISHSENQEPFDIVLLDHEMPGLNGFETAEFIKQSPKISDTKIILMPSFGRRGHAQVAVEKGISAYLIKPVRQVELFDCVSAIMGGYDSDSGDNDRSQLSGSLITRHSMLENRLENGTPILIVSDTVKNQNLIGEQLELLGYRSEIVSNSVEAFEALKKRSYSLVLIEINDQSESVFSSAGGVRRVLDTAVPFIAITPETFEYARYRTVGISEHLALPLDRERLRETIAKFVGNLPESTFIEDLAEQRPLNSKDHDELGMYFQQLTEEIGPEMVALNVSLFAEDSSIHLKGLRNAVVTRDFNQIGRIAGSLRRVCEDNHARDMQKICLLLETEAKNDDFDAVSRSVENLALGYDAVIAQLEQMQLHLQVG